MLTWRRVSGEYDGPLLERKDRTMATTQELLKEISIRLGNLAAWVASAKPEDVTMPPPPSGWDNGEEWRRFAGWVERLVMDKGRCNCGRCQAIKAVAKAIRMGQTELDMRTNTLIEMTCEQERKERTTPSPFPTNYPPVGPPMPGLPPPKSTGT